MIVFRTVVSQASSFDVKNLPSDSDAPRKISQGSSTLRTTDLHYVFLNIFSLCVHGQILFKKQIF